MGSFDAIGLHATFQALEELDLGAPPAQGAQASHALPVREENLPRATQGRDGDDRDDCNDICLHRGVRFSSFRRPIPFAGQPPHARSAHTWPLIRAGGRRLRPNG